jgi:capsular exopolysaccharide synthesis family protein
VHQIRTMLQISADSQDRRVFCVTSPSPGDGKTSLTLALGLSFATAGSRTLLIDLDLVGAGLTNRMSVNSNEGILEAVSNRSILPYVQSTDITDLSILPVGRAGARHASMLSPAVVRKLVTEARNHFDTVLIDTGPILGSIEASPVCVSADAVILAVARGQQRPLVERALNHLMSIGARLAGVVFNRAQARDFEQSVSRISMRSLRAPVNGNGHGPHDPSHPPERRQPQLGPVARAVAKSVHTPGSSTAGNGENHG